MLCTHYDGQYWGERRAGIGFRFRMEGGSISMHSRSSSRHLIRLVVLGCLFLAFATLGTPTAASAQACGTLKKHPKSGYQHVIWIWMENHNYEQIIGSASAPYINDIATQCGVATNFHNLTHVSLGNYIGAVTGLPLLDAKTHDDLQAYLLDCILNGPADPCNTAAPSLFERVPSWKAYMESMTANCQTSCATPPCYIVGYAVRHNPPAFLTNLAATCGTFDVPYTNLQADLDSDQLPAFAFITPNTVNDMHDGGDPISIQHGDTWLATELPKILKSAAYTSGKTVVFITFDEGEVSSGDVVGRDCANNTTDADCHVATIVLSPFTKPGTQYAKPLNHYSMLRTTEELLKIKKKNWVGLSTKAKSMKSAFHL
jgi:hypothetical protein